MTTPVRRQSKTLLIFVNADQNSLETVFSIYICRRTTFVAMAIETSKFLTIIDLHLTIVLTFSIA